MAVKIDDAWKKRCKIWALADGSVYSSTATAPAPSKNFVQIFVTDSEVIFRVWKIIPPTRADANQMPRQTVGLYKEFLEDDKFRGELEINMGENELHFVDKLIAGQIDYLNRMPKDVLVKILYYMDLITIVKLGQVNKYLYEVCSCNELWSKIYKDYNESPVTQDLLMLVDQKGWKEVFFMNKLQLQMMIRRHQAPSKDNGSFFLTTQEAAENENDVKEENTEESEEENEERISMQQLRIDEGSDEEEAGRDPLALEDYN